MNSKSKLLITSTLTALSLHASAVDITNTDVTISEDSTAEHVFTQSGTANEYRTLTIEEDTNLEASSGADDAISVDNNLQYLSVVNNGNITNQQSTAQDVTAIDLDNGGSGTSNTMIQNNGDINVSNDLGKTYGIIVDQESTITNNGSITSNMTNTGNTDLDSWGIYAGDSNNITNNGSINSINSSSGLNSTNNGIQANNNNIITNAEGASITVNTPTYSQEDSDIFAIQAENGNTISNEGTISVRGGYNSFGIEVGDNSSVTNSGTISVETEGDDVYGIRFGAGTDSTITNSGTINVKSLSNVSGRRSYGIDTDSDSNATIINRGTIISYTEGLGGSSRGYAINLESGAASDDRLNVYNYGTASGSAFDSIGYGLTADDHINIYNYGTFTGIIRNGSSSSHRAKGISIGDESSSVLLHNYGTVEAFYTGIDSNSAGNVWSADLEYGGEVKNFKTMTAEILQGSGNAYGVASQIDNPNTTNAGLTVDNYGTICATAKSGDAYGFLAFGGDKRINLHPGSTIKAHSDSGSKYAVAFTDGINNTDSDRNIVYLSSAARVYGGIKFTEGNDNQLIIDDLNNDDSNIHYEVEGNYTLSILNPQGLYLNGSVVYVSQTNFAMMNEVTNQLVGGIDNSVDNRLSSQLNNQTDTPSF